MNEYRRQTKQLRQILSNPAARDNKGRVSVRARGGRHKRYYRLIDWKRDKRDIKAEVMAIEYDPNRSCEIALVKYTDAEFRYILHPIGLKVGDKIIASDKAPIKPGSAMSLKYVPIGVEIHNIEMIQGEGGQIARGAGTACLIIGKDEKHAHLKLPSGEIRKVNLNCYATIGKLGNENRKNEELGKAGRKRHLGKRPKVRGVAMHPGAHPHGGGEGRSGEGMHPKTPWGKSSQGKTREKKKSSNKLIVKRRK